MAATVTVTAQCVSCKAKRQIGMLAVAPLCIRCGMPMVLVSVKKLQVSRKWLRQKIESDPDIENDAGPDIVGEAQS